MQRLREAGTTEKSSGGAGILGMAKMVLLAFARDIEMPRGK
jgi:hypothetical protein